MESQGQIQDLLNVLRARKWQILLPAIFVLVLGIAFAVIVPKKYLVVTRVELRENQLADDEGAKGEIDSVQYHIKHFGRVRSVIESDPDLWSEYFELERAERGDFVRDVMDEIDVTALEKPRERGSTFLDISYKDVDPKRAERFLTELRGLWIEEVVERELTELENELGIIQNQRKDALDRYEELQRKYFELAQDMGIDPNQPLDSRSQNAGDAVKRRHDELVAERDELQVEISGEKGELEQLQEQLATQPRMIPRELDESDQFAQEALALAGRIKDLEDELARYTPAHSRYREIQGQIADLRRREADLETLRLQAKSQLQEALNPEYAAIERQIRDAQARLEGRRAKLARLDGDIADLEGEFQARLAQYETLSRLGTDRELALDDVQALGGALREKDLELKKKRDAWQSPFDIAQEPEASEEPTEPNAALIVAVALLVGLALGLVVAVVAEFARNAFRSAHDLRNVMDVPVLGSINTIVTRRERRQARSRRTLVGVSSAVVLSAVLWVTFTWSSSPDRLPLGVVEAIEGFRKLLL